MKAAQADPQLRAAQASHMAQVESSFASALAERLGTDPDRDPYPMLLASTATAVLRSTMSFWAGAGGTVPLEQLVDAAFQSLADGFPQNGALHDLATGPPRAAPPAGAPRAVTQNFETERDDNK
jgi:hypothetical protein